MINMRSGIFIKFMGACFLLLVPAVFPVAAESPVNDEMAAVTPAENLLGLYKKWLSPIHGGRCPMYPSCSHYSRQAVRKHGLFRGWIMTCDRLLRCGRDEVSLAPKIIINNRVYSHDSLEDNDDWCNR